MRRTAHPSCRLVLLATSLGCASLVAGGCYEHVVGVRGPASQNYDIQEANIQPGESVWSADGPRPVDADRYSGTTLDRAKPAPVSSKKQAQQKQLQ